MTSFYRWQDSNGVIRKIMAPDYLMCPFCEAEKGLHFRLARIVRGPIPPLRDPEDADYHCHWCNKTFSAQFLADLKGFKAPGPSPDLLDALELYQRLK